MKKILLILTLLCPIIIRAQTNSIPLPTNAPPVIQTGTGLFDFLASSSNLMVIPYGIYSSGDKGAGGGMALAYRVSDYVAPTMRWEFLKGNFYQASFSTELQYPVKIGGKITVVPFALGGVAVPFGSGSGDKNTTAQGIGGLGAALRLDFLGKGKLWSHLDVVADWEKWSALPGNQYRLGLIYKF